MALIVQFHHRPLLGALAVIVLVNIVFLSTHFLIMTLWNLFLIGVITAAITLCEATVFPRVPLGLINTDALLCVNAVLLWSGPSALEWRWSFAGFVVVSLFLDGISHSVSYWSTAGVAGRARLVLHSLVVFTATVLQWVYYYTLDYVDGAVEPPNSQYYRQLALVGSFIHVTDAVVLVAACGLLSGGLELCELFRQFFFPGMESFQQSALDPTMPSFHLVPTALTRVCAIGYCCVISFDHPSWVLQWIIGYLVLCFFSSREQWRNYCHALDQLPVLPAPESSLCCICLENIEVTQPVRQLPCGHFFHGACLRNWISAHHHCPMCRGPVPIPHSEARSSSAPPMAPLGGAPIPIPATRRARRTSLSVPVPLPSPAPVTPRTATLHTWAAFEVPRAPSWHLRSATGAPGISARPASPTATSGRRSSGTQTETATDASPRPSLGTSENLFDENFLLNSSRTRRSSLIGTVRHRKRIRDRSRTATSTAREKSEEPRHERVPKKKERRTS